MNKSCEEVLAKSQQLRLLGLEDYSLNIFNYLNKNYQINFLKIYIKKQNDIENLFDNSKENENYLFNTLKFKQSNEYEVIFSLLFTTQKEFEDIKNRQDFIKLALEIFSQSLFSKYLEKVIEDISIIDTLTGNYNRHYLYHYIEPLFSLSNRKQEKIAFLRISIDHFKAVIDEFNYKVGDKVIKVLSKTIKSSIRDSDTVIRMTNDGHLIILPNITNSDNAVLVANKLIDKFSKEKIIVNENTKQTLMKTICVGITIYPDDGIDIDTIIRKSDIALYEAKNMGRSTVFVFNEEETNKVELF
ncbi:GGDEF domain-containing protein [Aliarcobacter butzleri]|uniref:GGDEF domain-containing protein n=2 Tax=Aliarcobacter butzleri TaxID=28197 RepID=A0AAW7Q9V7_9BACT|nr:GGDEF domain-containing protein [Aliarcobacter butzleri]MCP3649302.1 GGDEF domain-containing protein [Arcobacter sp. DNRA7]MCG3669031.1 GGDEF domain-containing protein [Aliarcobacter butzleri]MCR1815475.1 GGDEF domain-containing protein [Aliarcobacter butzleri]MDN5088039.1 GGDEF domain-containing protein [Aliarcobacter butzleri]MDN5106445.1 GGDEF domain-containing protein [Aliarcobacter butzleri]